MTAEPASARKRLLAAVLTQARASGLGDVSLRSLAAAISTSHRMLLYHFGSREGLVAAVVAEIEAQQRGVMADLAAAWAGDPAATLRAFWASLADPGQHEAERLFFEAVALALRDRPGTAGLRQALIEPWLAVFGVAAERIGLPRESSRLDARIGMALTRGLLLDLLVTGDRAGVDAAMERFIGRYLPEDAAGGPDDDARHLSPDRTPPSR
jgi:AcrR family transcriptional regulator